MSAQGYVAFCTILTHTLTPDMLKPRGQNFGLGLITSGFGTLWPRPQAFGLGLEL